MSTTEPAAPAEAAAATPATLDDLMLAMDVVDTLRHRERLIERELNEDVREEQLIERLRALYKSQGLEVPDSVIEQGVKALKESRFVYTPPRPSFARTLATLWVRRAVYGKGFVAALAVLVVIIGFYHFGVVRPRERAAEPRESSSPRGCHVSLPLHTGQSWRRPRLRSPGSGPMRSFPGPRRARSRQCGGRARGGRRARPACGKAAAGIRPPDRRAAAGSDWFLP